MICKVFLLRGVCDILCLFPHISLIYHLLDVTLFSFQGTIFRIWILSSVIWRGGDEENRTPDPLLARQVLSQLSYTPIFGLMLHINASICFSLDFLCDCRVLWYTTEQKNSKWTNLVGLSGLEPPTSRLSGVRSNRLSYRPMQGTLWVLISFLCKIYLTPTFSYSF